MKFCVENISDIDKYFRNTFVKFTGLRGTFQDGTDCPPAEELVHSVERISGNIISGKRWEDGQTIPYQFYLYPEADAHAPDVEFILPKKSFFNADEGAYLLQRIPARQYRRGICADNTIIQLLHSGGGFINAGVDMSLLNKYIQKPCFYPFAERAVSYAVSRRMAVAVTGHIYVDYMDIGTINYETGVINVLPMFHAEVEGVLKQHSQHMLMLAPPAGAVPKKRKGKAYVGKATAPPKGYVPADVTDSLQF